MSRRCIGEPISWLRLERHHLGELADSERAQIEAHLAACSACASCLAEIEREDAVALLPLPPPGEARALRAEAAREKGRPRARVGRVVVGVAGVLAAAAAALLSIGGSWRNEHRADESRAGRAKGDAIAFTLVRDDGERFERASGVYRDGDRFKAIVTCVPGTGLTFDLVVFDSEGTSFPLSPASDLPCGNEVPLPGAFRLTGSGEETVCLVWEEGTLPDRATTSTENHAREGKSICKTLRAKAEPGDR